MCQEQDGPLDVDLRSLSSCLLKLRAQLRLCSYSQACYRPTRGRMHEECSHHSHPKDRAIEVEVDFSAYQLVAEKMLADTERYGVER